jgi:hypothetical protein
VSILQAMFAAVSVCFVTALRFSLVRQPLFSIFRGGARLPRASQLFNMSHSHAFIFKLYARLRAPHRTTILTETNFSYYPSVFVLKPGQWVHINKGRLHAFRKLAPTRLKAKDCHHDLRRNVLASLPSQQEQLCISVAWDWTFRGITPEGMNREAVTMLECASLNRNHNTQSLAIPETCVLQTAHTYVALLKQKEQRQQQQQKENEPLPSSSTSFLPPSSATISANTTQPDPLTVLKGLLPSLLHIIRRHKAAEDMARCAAVKTANASGEESRSRVIVALRPDTWENPQLFTVDPHGNDFFCKLCSEELSNVYLHCIGCEVLLNKDFNICVSCHSEQRYKQKINMHPLNTKNHSTINHTGNFYHCRQGRCPCKNGPVCKACGYCCGCSCMCHERFTLRQRFMTIPREYQLLQEVQALVKDSAEAKLPMRQETRKRLEFVREIPSTKPPSKKELDQSSSAAFISGGTAAEKMLNNPATAFASGPLDVGMGGMGGGPPKHSSISHNNATTKKRKAQPVMYQEDAALLGMGDFIPDGYYKPKPSTSRQLAMADSSSTSGLGLAFSVPSIPAPSSSLFRPTTADWTSLEETDLVDAFNQIGKGNWASISVVIFNRSKSNEQCRQRNNRYRKDKTVGDSPANPWTDEEAIRLQAAFDRHRDDWTAVAAAVGTNRSELHVSIEVLACRLPSFVQKRARQKCHDLRGFKYYGTACDASYCMKLHMRRLFARQTTTTFLLCICRRVLAILIICSHKLSHMVSCSFLLLHQCCLKLCQLRHTQKMGGDFMKQIDSGQLKVPPSASLKVYLKASATAETKGENAVVVPVAPSISDGKGASEGEAFASAPAQAPVVATTPAPHHAPPSSFSMRPPQAFSSMAKKKSQADPSSMSNPIPRKKKAKTNATPSRSTVSQHWTAPEEERLIELYNQVGKGNWQTVAAFLAPLASAPGHAKTNEQCRGKIDKLRKDWTKDVGDLARTPWTEEETITLYDIFMAYGGGNDEGQGQDSIKESWLSMAIGLLDGDRTELHVSLFRYCTNRTPRFLFLVSSVRLCKHICCSFLLMSPPPFLVTTVSIQNGVHGQDKSKDSGAMY